MHGPKGLVNILKALRQEIIESFDPSANRGHFSRRQCIYGELAWHKLRAVCGG